MGGLEVREKRMSREEFLVPFEINTDLIESKLNEDAAEIVKENVTKKFYEDVNKLIDGYFSNGIYGNHPSISDTYIEKKIDEVIVEHEDEIVNKSVDRLVTLISKRKAMKDKYGSLLDGE